MKINIEVGNTVVIRVKERIDTEDGKNRSKLCKKEISSSSQLGILLKSIMPKGDFAKTISI